MKITIICHEIPYPANSGGRVDAWRRIKAFSEFGAELQLITWYKETPQPEILDEIDKYVYAKYLIPFPSSLPSLIRRVIDLRKYPLEVTSRLVRGQKRANLLAEVKRFSPDIIWLDHLHGAEIAHFLEKECHVPIITRSHNIEHLYYQRLRASAGDLKNIIKRTLSIMHLKQYEFANLKKSAFFYDISPEDLKFWQNLGFQNGHYLPPLIDFAAFERDLQAGKHQNNRQYDLVFLGNLYSDNNVAGIIWFINEVLPKVQRVLPQTSVLIAGSKPTKKVQELCHNNHKIELRINPPSTSLIYNCAKVLINPIATGSGVSMKSLEMLLAQKPIVSRPQGIAGLPPELNSYFNIAEKAEDFAAEIINLLAGKKQAQVANRSLLESLFGFQAINTVLQELDSLIVR